MDNKEVSELPKQEILVPQSINQISTPNTPKHKWSWTKFFLGFFVLEHLIIIFTVGIFLYQYIKTYKYSEFAVLNQNAIAFKPTPSELVFDEIEKNLLDILPKSQDEKGWKEFEFSISESQVNSILQSLDLVYIDKIYLMFPEENEILIWVNLDNFSQPLMIKAIYKFDNISGFTTNITNIQIGALPIPRDWVLPISYSLSNTLNNIVLNTPDEYEYKVINISTENEVLQLTMQITANQYTKLHGYLLSKHNSN